MTKIIIGSARIDENGNVSGGKAGDQKQTKINDYSGEVSLQEFYMHPLGWMLIRPKNPVYAKKLASKMLSACNNKRLGYSQRDRYGVIMYGICSNRYTNCDCTSLIRACIREAYNVDPGDFITSNEVAVLKKTELFDISEYHEGDELYGGDILVTKKKGHTVMVVEGCSRDKVKEVKDEVKEEKPKNTRKKSIATIAKEVIAGKWGAGEERKKRLTEAGYDYAKVQAKVNALLK